MKKLYLLDVIEKYHLGGFVEKVKIEIKDKTLSTQFISANKNLIGTMVAPNIELEDCEFGVYDTHQLRKLVNITDQLITLSVQKQGKVSTKLTIADIEYNLEYALADPRLTPAIPTFDEPEYEMEAIVDKEFIEKFIKAKKALDTEVFIIKPSYDALGNDVLLFTLGGTDGYTNKISFYIPTIKTKVLGNQTKFPLAEFNEMLLANKTMISGKLFVSEQGVLKIEFTNEDNVEISYVLVGKE
jgi:hypothetical protein